MSKKETEFDRYDRMKKLERESEAQKRKNEFLEDDVTEKSGKSKRSSASGGSGGHAWSKLNAANLEEEYDYV